MWLNLVLVYFNLPLFLRLCNWITAPLPDHRSHSIKCLCFPKLVRASILIGFWEVTFSVNTGWLWEGHVFGFKLKDTGRFDIRLVTPAVLPSSPYQRQTSICLPLCFDVFACWTHISMHAHTSLYRELPALAPLLHHSSPHFVALPSPSTVQSSQALGTAWGEQHVWLPGTPKK